MKNNTLMYIENIKDYEENIKNDYNQVYLLDPSRLFDSSSFNILAYAKQIYDKGDIDNALDMVEHISKIIFDNTDHTDPFWENQASDLFVGTTISLFLEKDIIRLEDVFDAINSYTEFNTGNDIINRYISGIYGAPTETKRSIFSVCIAKLKCFVTREALNKLLGSNSFLLNEDNICIVVVGIKRDDIGPKVAKMIYTNIKDIIEYEHLNYDIKE